MIGRSIHWFLAAAIMLTGCDPISGVGTSDEIRLEITSDAPAGGRPLETLRLFFRQGALRVPEHSADPAFSFVLGDVLDPTTSPVSIGLQLFGGGIEAGPIVLLATSYSDGRPFSSWQGHARAEAGSLRGDPFVGHRRRVRRRWRWLPRLLHRRLL